MKKVENSQLDFTNTWVNPALPTISISQVLTLIQEPFDSQGVAEKTYNKHFNNPESEYYQMSVDDIIKEWNRRGKVSCEYGAMLDDYIGLTLNEEFDELEMYKLDHNYDNDERLRNVTGSFDEFIKFIETNTNLRYVTREKTVFLEMDGYYVKGRFDCLFYDPDKDIYIIIDWKSTDKIELKPNQWTKKLLGAANGIDALNGNTYTLQTHFYKKSLLKHYLPAGTNPNKVTVRIINLPGHLFDDGKNYSVIKENIPYNDDTLAKIFEFAYKKNALLKKKK